MRGEDGRRRLRWERTEGGETPVELPIENDPATAIDVEAIRGETAAFLGRIALKIGVEKRKAALLLYVTAMDVAVRNPNVRSAAERALAAIGENRSVEAGRDWRELLAVRKVLASRVISQDVRMASGPADADLVADVCVFVLQLLAE